MEAYKTKVQIIYEKLKDAILSGEYEPGERIIIRQFSKENDVSDIPVREAIRILESEGLVALEPNKGPVVSVISELDIRYQSEIRGVLEGYITRISMEKLEEEDLADLENIVNRMRQAMEKHDYKDYAALNRLFHITIYEKCENTALYQMVLETWNKWERNRSVFNLVPQRIDESIQEHAHIVQLLREGKGPEVEEYVRYHKHQVGLSLIEYLKRSHE